MRRVKEMNNKLNDLFLEDKWYELEQIPFDENEEEELILSEDWFIFKKGTEREDIWHWFDRRYSKGVCYLLYEL